VKDVTKVAVVALKKINIGTIKTPCDTSHHHIGALDLIPVHPYNHSTLPEAGSVARGIAHNLNNLSVPTLLYGHAHPYLHSLVAVRRRTKFFSRGQSLTLSDVDDTATRVMGHSNTPWHITELTEPHPTVGISVVGATNYVLSYNIVLDTTDLSFTNSVVRDVRSEHVQAMGYVNKFNGRDVTEVACNMLNTDREGCEEIREKVEQLAGERGVKVVHSYSTNPQLSDIPRLLKERSL